MFSGERMKLSHIRASPTFISNQMRHWRGTDASCFPFQPFPIRITALDDDAARIDAHFAARHAGASDCERKIGVAGGGPEQAEPAREEAAFADALDRLADANLHRRLVIDASHANASRRYLNQVGVCADIAAQTAGGSTGIAGVMIESNLVEGRQTWSRAERSCTGKVLRTAARRSASPSTCSRNWRTRCAHAVRHERLPAIQYRRP